VASRIWSFFTKSMSGDCVYEWAFTHLRSVGDAVKFLMLSFYYPPDLSAGSFRMVALVEACRTAFPGQVHLDVMTTLPNRYSTFANAAPSLEEYADLRIRRLPLPPHQSGMLDQSRAFMKYLSGVLRLTRGQRYDAVFATSSRLMTAALGTFVGRRLNVPVYLDIRDIFVDTIGDVMSNRLSGVFKPVLSALEGWCIRSAAKVNLVSAGFLPYFQSRYPDQHYSVFTNGIDEEFMRVQPVGRVPADRQILEVLYAGNIGEGQGLHEIIPHLAKRFAGRLRFRIFGDGGRRKQLEQAVARIGGDNVELLAPINRKALIQAYQATDILFLHLNDYPAFLKVLPSKVFEYAALGKPIWAGVSGHSAEFLRKHVTNVAVFSPCNVEEAVLSFETLEQVTAPRREFVEVFARSSIMREMAVDLMNNTVKVPCESC
jgi:hypothetical protein